VEGAMAGGPVYLGPASTAMYSKCLRPVAEHLRLGYNEVAMCWDRVIESEASAPKRTVRPRPVPEPTDGSAQDELVTTACAR